MMKITLNGKVTAIEPDSTVAALLGQLGLDSRQVVAELNGGILPRADFAARQLAAGDTLELVHFVGGG